MELKPCPFCGAQPKGPHKTSTSDERSGYNFSAAISCPCGVSISKPSHHDKHGWCDDTGQAVADVTEAWNRRTPIASPQQTKAERDSFIAGELRDARLLTGMILQQLDGRCEITLSTLQNFDPRQSITSWDDPATGNRVLVLQRTTTTNEGRKGG